MSEVRLYTVRVEGETAAGVRFNELVRVAAVDYGGAKARALRRYPGCRVFNLEIEQVQR